MWLGGQRPQWMHAGRVCAAGSRGDAGGAGCAIVLPEFPLLSPTLHPEAVPMVMIGLKVKPAGLAGVALAVPVGRVVLPTDGVPVRAPAVVVRAVFRGGAGLAPPLLRRILSWAGEETRLAAGAPLVRGTPMVALALGVAVPVGNAISAGAAALAAGAGVGVVAVPATNAARPGALWVRGAVYH